MRKLRVVEGSGVGPGDLVGEYLATLGGRSVSTVEAGAAPRRIERGAPAGFGVCAPTRDGRRTAG